MSTDSKMENRRQEILLESGTNEVEIIEFYLNDQSFGINVQKLREIVPFNPENVTRGPGQPESMLGMFLLRGRLSPLIDLKMHLNKKPKAGMQEIPDDKKIVFVCEFNGKVNSFLVDGVNQIHRVSWKDVKPMPEFFGPYTPRFTGSVRIDKREILIVDMEHVVTEIFPEQGLSFHTEEEVGTIEKSANLVSEMRKDIKIFLAEDSAMIRKGIKSVLEKAGYNLRKAFVDGKKCHSEFLKFKEMAEANKEPITKYVDLVISDIEMPEMDGLSLCKHIKEDPVMKDIRVVMFSSLINRENEHKCDEVRADAHISKPQIVGLVSLVDELLFG